MSHKLTLGLWLVWLAIKSKAFVTFNESRIIQGFEGFTMLCSHHEPSSDVAFIGGYTGGVGLLVKLNVTSNQFMWNATIGNTSSQFRAITMFNKFVYATGKTSQLVQKQDGEYKGGSDGFSAKIDSDSGSISSLQQWGTAGDDSGDAIVYSGSRPYIYGQQDGNKVGFSEDFFGVSTYDLLPATSSVVGAAKQFDIASSKYVVAGSTNATLVGAPVNGTDFYVTTVDNQGLIGETFTYGTTGDDLMTCFAYDLANKVMFMAGLSRSAEGTSMLIMSVFSNGTLNWKVNAAPALNSQNVTRPTQIIYNGQNFQLFVSYNVLSPSGQNFGTGIARFSYSNGFQILNNQGFFVESASNRLVVSSATASATDGTLFYTALNGTLLSGKFHFDDQFVPDLGSPSAPQAGMDVIIIVIAVLVPLILCCGLAGGIIYYLQRLINKNKAKASRLSTIDDKQDLSAQDSKAPEPQKQQSS